MTALTVYTDVKHAAFWAGFACMMCVVLISGLTRPQKIVFADLGFRVMYLAVAPLIILG